MFEAYGWDKTEDFETEDRRKEDLLTRLVALNHERAAEERTGHIRWLRPEYQCPVDPDAPSPDEAPSLPGTDVPPSSTSKIKNQQSPIINPSPTAWPKGVAAQFTAVTHLLPTTGPDAEAISATFGRKSKTRVREIEEILETLKSLGKLE